MGKTSKFSFPLPGRKKQFSETSEDLSLPDEPKLSKVERLLGTTDLPPQYQVAANKTPLLSRQASSITLNLYEPTIADGRSDAGTPIPDVPALPDFVRSRADVESPWASQISLAPPRSLSVSQAHPPRQFAEASKRNHPRSQSSNDILSVQYAQLRPSTTSNGHAYTAIQLNPYVANNKEPRQGPRTSNGNSHSLFPVVEAASSDAYPTESYPLSGYKPGNKPVQKKRPTRLDLSKLLGRTSSTSNPAAKAMTSPSSASITHNPPRFPTDVRSPADVTSPTAKLSMPRRLAKKASISNVRSGESGSRPKTAGELDGRKHQTSRTSPVKFRASKHWFDGLLEAEDDVFSERGSSFEEQPSITASYSIRPVEASPPAQRQQPTIAYTSPVKERYAQTVQDVSQNESLQAVHSYSNAPRCIRPVCSDRLEQILQKQPSPLVSEFAADDMSVLRGHDNATGQEHSSQQEFDVRDSLALSDMDEAVTIGEAQVLNVRNQRSQEAVTVEVKRIVQPRQLRIVNTTRSNMTSREPTPHLARKQSIPIVAAEATSLDHRRPVSSKSASASARTSLQSNRSMSDSRHKMMAVTAEEEVLLAMMRQKRAAMQSHSFAEGFKTALLSSPQTPGFQGVPYLLRHDAPADHGVVARRKTPSKQHVRSHDYASEKHGLYEPTTSIVSPRPTRVYVPQSRPMMHNELDRSHASDADDALSTTPETGHSGFHSSPSEKSVHSGLHSPVTPHSASTSINLAMNSMPWLKTDEFSDDMFAATKYMLENDSPSHRSLVSDSVMSADVPLAASRSLVEDGRATYNPFPVTAHIAQQYIYHSKNSYAPHAVEPAQQQTFSAQLTARSHTPREHNQHHGCCGTGEPRCSVAGDVMDAWTSLGGWQDQRTPLY